MSALLGNVRFLMVVVPGLAFGLWSGAAALADECDPKPTPYFANDLDRPVPYMKLLANSEHMLRCAQTKRDLAMALQWAAWVRSFVGDIKGADAAVDRFLIEIAGVGRKPKDPVGDISPYEGFDAIREIVKASKGRQIVILNEAHHRPRHRAFGLLLANALRREGFQVLAAEGFIRGVEERIDLDAPSPDLMTGFYTREPVFADFVRQSARSGFRLVSYDYGWKDHETESCKNICARETAQATNLFQKIFENDPDARIFIFVGYSHVSEKWSDTDPDAGWMAARLQRMTGIDPLTIDQVGGTERTQITTDAVMDRVLAQFQPKVSSVYRAPDGPYLRSRRYREMVDMTVFHPRQTEKNGRMDWMSMDGYRKPALVVLKGGASEKRRLLQAFVASDTKPAVIPMDQVLVPPGADRVTLMVPPGEYRLVLQDEAGVSTEIGRKTMEP